MEVGKDADLYFFICACVILGLKRLKKYLGQENVL